MFCRECGKEISDKASVCVGCGVAVENKTVLKQKSINKYSTLITVILPLVSVFVAFVAYFVSLSCSQIYGNALKDGKVYARMEPDALIFIFMFILVVMACANSIVSVILNFVQKHENKFNAILSFAISISVVLYFILEASKL